MILNENNFQEAIASDKPVVVDFWAPWCGPCNAVAPIVNKLAEELKDRFVVGKVNVDEEKGLATKYNIGSIPCFIFFKDGEIAKAVGKDGYLYGLQTEQTLRENLEKLA